MILPENTKNVNESDDLPGYPLYAPSEDIYNKEKKDTHINPDDNSEIADVILGSKWNEEDYDTTLSGDDLDVPGRIVLPFPNRLPRDARIAV